MKEQTIKLLASLLMCLLSTTILAGEHYHFSFNNFSSQDITIKKVYQHCVLDGQKFNLISHADKLNEKVTLLTKGHTFCEKAKLTLAYFNPSNVKLGETEFEVKATTSSLEPSEMKVIKNSNPKKVKIVLMKPNHSIDIIFNAKGD